MDAKLSRKCIGIGPLLLLSGCAIQVHLDRLTGSGMEAPPPVTSGGIMVAPSISTGVAATATSDDDPAATAALNLALEVQSHIQAYIEDPLSAFEQPEIARVQADLAEFCGEHDEARALADAIKLEESWATLKALDRTLQKENLI